MFKKSGSAAVKFVQARDLVYRFSAPGARVGGLSMLRLFWCVWVVLNESHRVISAFFDQSAALSLFSAPPPPSVSCTPLVWHKEVFQITGIFLPPNPVWQQMGWTLILLFFVCSPSIKQFFLQKDSRIFFCTQWTQLPYFFPAPQIFICSTELAAFIFLMQRSFVTVKPYTNHNNPMAWWLGCGGSNGRPLFFAPLVNAPFPILNTCPSSRKSEVCHQPRMEFMRCNTRPIAHLEAHFHFQTLELYQP